MPESTTSLLDPQFLAKLEQLSLASRNVLAGQSQGERRSPKRGASVEFADFREYQSGDDLRYVDWKAYGRLDKLFLKLFVEEENLNLHLLLDTSRSMGFGAPMTKTDYARRVAGALGFIALSGFDRVSAAGFGSKLGAVLPPQRGPQGILPLFHFLSNQAETDGATEFGASLTRYAAGVQTGGIAVVLSDFFDDTVEHGLKALLARRLQVVLIHVLDSEEVAPTMVGDLRLVDAESGDAREVSLSPYLLEQYAARLHEFRDGLRGLANRYGMDYVPAVTNVPFEDVIFKFLRRQNVLR